MSAKRMRSPHGLGPVSKAAAKRVLARAGLRVERVPAADRILERGYDPRRPPPASDLAYLSPSNPRLLELTERYAAHVSSVGDQSLWREASVSAAEDLRFFRGDNLYLWQYSRSSLINRYRFFIYGKHVQQTDDLGLLSLLREDGAFGCLTFDYVGLPTLSRDLLDSVLEIGFLARHTDVIRRSGAQVIDIGAGYGRLAERMLTAAPELGHYWCFDAIARSSFLCDYYLRHRGLTDRATVVALPELREVLSPGQIDLAVNVHSFSEMPRSAIAGWLAWLAELQVPMLLIVPNERDLLLSRERDGSRVPCEDLLDLNGYVLEVSEPTITDPSVRGVLGVHDFFLLYRRQL